MKTTPQQKHIVKSIDRAIGIGIEKHVNGKIRELRREQQDAHIELKKEISTVKDSVKEVLEAFQETSAFFKVIMRISRFLIPIGGASGIIYAIFRFIKQ